ncbi:nucleoside diphosphate kinase regulator [Oricola nitratireducens]|uniref:nucleoside diphosphate kinase regulator n=1 Tax=Oricola nitratireducens TaxID=2775868 RepID=UPI0018687B77|nr:nucleoside diphosphate kinase regulator [Oricola nitratireducens]
MAPVAARIRKPTITLGRTDHDKLTRLAETVQAGNAEVVDVLFSELDRAGIVPDARLAEDVIRMGSHVRYATETGEVREVTLVYPGRADISAGRISILTPIGAALIGLSSGQSMDWRARDGRVHRLVVQSVGVSEPGGQGQ